MKKAVFLQALASLLMLSPLFFLNSAAFAGNTDGLFYTTVLTLMSHHMAHGDWLAHWLPEANNGVGSPVMLFYNPLAYYLTAIIGVPLTPFDPMGWKRLALGMFVSQWTAGVAAYAWLRRRASGNTALIASLLFTVFPYKLVYIFLHINLAQLWALVWLPLIMIAAEDMAAQKPKATAWYALWLGLLALTHPRTMIAFGAVPALYVLVFTANRNRVLSRLLAAHALAAGIAAFYLLPAVLNLGLVRVDLANTGRMYYAANLSHKDVALNFHYAVIGALCLGLLARMPRLRASREGHDAWFYLAALTAAALLCLRLSQPLWDALPPLQFLQFPAARLHVVALIAATALAAFFLDHTNEVREWRWLYSPATLLLAVAVMTVLTLHYICGIYNATEITWPYIENMHAKHMILPPEYQLKAAVPAAFAGEKQGVALTLLSLLIVGWQLCKNRKAA